MLSTIVKLASRLGNWSLPSNTLDILIASVPQLDELFCRATCYANDICLHFALFDQMDAETMSLAEVLKRVIHALTSGFPEGVNERFHSFKGLVLTQYSFD